MSNIEDQARYYNNLPLRYRNIKAVVHLEAKEDIPFWDYQLQNAYPSKYHYVAYSKNNSGLMQEDASNVFAISLT